jgi:hypothetical protein
MSLLCFPFGAEKMRLDNFSRDHADFLPTKTIFFEMNTVALFDSRPVSVANRGIFWIYVLTYCNPKESPRFDRVTVSSFFVLRRGSALVIIALVTVAAVMFAVVLQSVLLFCLPRIVYSSSHFSWITAPFHDSKFVSRRQLRFAPLEEVCFHVCSFSIFMSSFFVVAHAILVFFILLLK